jgi:predicted transcriptional regulator
MNVLLSIKPEFAQRIFDGNKKYEYRKTIFKRGPIDKVLIYVTSPVCVIMGEFEIDEILSDRPHNLWRKTSRFAGVSKEFFLDYFTGRYNGYAIRIKSSRKYRIPINPRELLIGFKPPQSFLYISENFAV